MLPDPQFQETAKSFVRVNLHYNGLGGSIIDWTMKAGSAKDHPSVLGFVLDPEGKTLGISKGDASTYEPRGFTQWLASFQNTSFPLIDPSAFTLLKKEAASVASRKKLGATLATLREKAGGEGDEAAEAKQLLEKVLPYAEWKWSQAEEAKETDPVASYERFSEIAKELQGDELGDRADEIVKALKKDKAFKDELAAHKIFAKIEAAATKLKKCNVSKPLDVASCDACRVANRGALAGMAKGLAKIVKKHDGTVTAGKAATLRDALNLK